MSEYKGTSHPLGKGERLESPGIGIFRFRQYNNLDVSGRQAVLQECGTAAEQQNTIKIGMHPDMSLQLTLNITDDVLNIGNASFLDLPGDIVPLEAVLQVALLDQEGYFHGGEGARRREILDPWQQKAGGHLVDTPLVKGLAMDDLFFMR